ncbi:hypothetical protein SAMN03159434_10610 [Enterobacter sp. NFR05]|nr:hypothetical protein SAMN03159434_10610 [Enterobacter sp. NFR05]
MNEMAIRAAFSPHPGPLPKEERGPFVLAFLWGFLTPGEREKTAYRICGLICSSHDATRSSVKSN